MVVNKTCIRLGMYIFTLMYCMRKLIVSELNRQVLEFYNIKHIFKQSKIILFNNFLTDYFQNKYV